MTFFKFVFTILWLIFTINIIQVIVEYNIREPIYRCDEVTKQDPIDVQKICNRRWKSR